MSDVEIPRNACRSCHRILALNVANFHRDSGNASGLKRQCRSCANAEARKRYEARAESVCQRLRERRIQRSAYFETQPQWGAA